MNNLNILIVGGGIGGLTAAIALGKAGHRLTIIEKDPDWAVYGVGHHPAVAMSCGRWRSSGIIDDYLEAGFGFDFVEVYIPTGERVARIPSPRLVEGYARQCRDRAAARCMRCWGGARKEAGAEVRLGLTVASLDDDGSGVSVRFSATIAEGRFDLVIGADGLYSQTREQIFPEAPKPAFTGQSVWRYNFPSARRSRLLARL